MCWVEAMCIHMVIASTNSAKVLSVGNVGILAPASDWISDTQNERYLSPETEESEGYEGRNIPYTNRRRVCHIRCIFLA